MKHEIAAVISINNVCHVCDDALLTMSIRGVQIFYSYTSTLLSVRVSQKEVYAAVKTCLIIEDNLTGIDRNTNHCLLLLSHTMIKGNR